VFCGKISSNFALLQTLQVSGVSEPSQALGVLWGYGETSGFGCLGLLVTLVSEPSQALGVLWVETEIPLEWDNVSEFQSLHRL
jgi:hypothetical protein